MKRLSDMNLQEPSPVKDTPESASGLSTPGPSMVAMAASSGAPSDKMDVTMATPENKPSPSPPLWVCFQNVI